MANLPSALTDRGTIKFFLTRFQLKALLEKYRLFWGVRHQRYVWCKKRLDDIIPTHYYCVLETVRVKSDKVRTFDTDCQQRYCHHQPVDGESIEGGDGDNF